jgi:hypothetical protein
MSGSHKKLKIKASKSFVAQCRDRARMEGVSLATLIKRAIAQYLVTPPTPPKAPLVAPTAISPSDYARLVARVERLEAQIAQLTIAVPSDSAPDGDGQNGERVSAGMESAGEEEDWQDLDEPDEILYNFLESPRSPY